ncbi:MAG TPA: LPS assembly lipoprotein LptE [Bdellovibrionota bacterium]|jgi:hypothetical protein
MLSTRVLVFCAPFLCLLSGCAYHFQGTSNPLSELGIRKIYVTEFRNKTYRPGIEQYFTTAMVREIARSRVLELVNSEKEADAVLNGEIVSAESVPGTTKVFTVGESSPPARVMNIATDYSSSVSCSVTLLDRRGRAVFFQTINDSKVHPGFAKERDAGQTGPLVNDSEQRLSVQFLASLMMSSVYQRMIDTF